MNGVGTLNLTTCKKAGEALKALNETRQGPPDLAPCSEIAEVFNVIRDRHVYASLDETTKGRLRRAARMVNQSCGEGDSKLIGFLEQVYGVLRRPAARESARREHIGTFLCNLALE